MKDIAGKKGTELSVFARDIDHGLSAKEKKISSKYLYNKDGSKFFEEIMDLPEYYLSKCEMEVLKKYKKDILEWACLGNELYLVDLGAGNGLKTMVLLNYFKGRTNFRYVPIDISKSALDELEETLHQKYDGLIVESIHSEYMAALEKLKGRENVRKLVLFLGSTIGNFFFKDAMRFFSDLHDSLNPNDLVLIGFDLKKDPHIIRTAYNDPRGVTAKFVLNLLKRINEELEGNFNIDNFVYYPSYDPASGEMKSYILSKEKQDVYVKALDKTFHFEQWETIHTECSNKYDLHIINELAERTNYIVEENFYDSKNYFLDSLWKVK